MRTVFQLPRAGRVKGKQPSYARNVGCTSQAAAVRREKGEEKR